MWKKLANFLVIGLIIYGLIITFSKNDKRANRVRLNNNGLSTNALVFKTKSKASLKSTLKQVEFMSTNDDQFQLQFIASNNIVYVYSKGMVLNLPITKGRRFALEDFSADVPFSIVGKDVSENVYLTELQNYYRLDNKYIPVVGFTGSGETQQLNKKVFVTANSRSLSDELKLNQVKVIGDGPKVVEQPQLFSRIFRSQSEQKYLPGEIPIIGSGWLKHSWIFILSAVLLLVALIVVTTYQFEVDINVGKKYANLKTCFLDLVVAGAVLFIGFKTQYIINSYILTFLVYLAILLAIFLGQYFARFRKLTS